jgi:hypothetical protein
MSKVQLQSYSLTVSLKVSQLLKRSLQVQENAYIVETIKATKMQYKPEKLAAYIVKRLNKLSKLNEAFESKTNNQSLGLINDNIDMHQYMIKKVREESSIPEYNTADTPLTQGVGDVVNPVNLATLFGLTTQKEIQMTFNPQARYIKNYLILDSKYRNLNTDGMTKFQWIYNDASDLPTRGVSTSGGTVSNIVAMKMYQFVFPNVSGLSADSGRLGVYIQEFKDASFIANGAASYHWLLRVAQGNTLPQPSPLFVQCETEDYQDGILYFNKPLVNIDRFTISFSDPLNTISIPYDRSIATLTYGATTTINTSIVNNLTIGGRVMITGFTTDDPSADAAVIAQMNDPLGLIVSNIIDADTFVVAVDTSTITPKVGLFINVYFAQFRFLIGLELTYIKE